MSDSEPLYVAVVDDDDNFCRSLGKLLRAAGMQAITYTSGKAFLADTKHPRFDCWCSTSSSAVFRASSSPGGSRPKAAAPCSACPMCGTPDPQTSLRPTKMVCRCHNCGAVWRVARPPEQAGDSASAEVGSVSESHADFGFGMLHV